MFKALLKWFRAENLLVQAQNLVLEMLITVQELFEDSVKLLWTGEGATIDDIRERDKAINQLVREVRKKVLTHLAFSGSGGIELSLVMVNLVVYIERIGDYTKDIAYLATDYPGRIEAGEFEPQVHEFEKKLNGRLKKLIDVFSEDEEDSDLAASLTGTHKEMNLKYRQIVDLLMDEERNKLSPRDSAKLSLYLRYLRRVEGQIFNVASSEVNPFHRISFKIRKKKK
ncbi:MAG: hypothetical protein FVQ81_14950 [Candidatus Glassbacteria bacterium]|nr:hypothetical protein [Candidatus Glassbacteria bacterium]